MQILQNSLHSFLSSFIEIGVDKDHVRFLLQSVPMYSATKIIQLI